MSLAFWPEYSYDLHEKQGMRCNMEQDPISPLNSWIDPGGQLYLDE
jgi:hypothetical protein